jgi:hypothetical protein
VGGPEQWAWFGDYFGGIVNPACGIITAFLVVRTLRVTREEAADSRAELQRQNEFIAQQMREARTESVASDLRRTVEMVFRLWGAASGASSHVWTGPSEKNDQLSMTRQTVISWSQSASDMAKTKRGLESAHREKLKDQWQKFFAQPVDVLTELAEEKWRNMTNL